MEHRHTLPLLPDAPRSRLAGVLAAAAAVALTTLLIYPLREVTPVVSTGVVYLIAVLLVSTYWGLWLGVVTAIASAAAFNWFHLPPTGRFTLSDAENWVALAVFVVAALVASSVAELARARTTEAERRREEADLAASLARTLLGSTTLAEALPAASAQLADGLHLSFAAIELGRVAAGADRAAVALGTARDRIATLLVPAELDAAALERLRTRVAPSLGALVAAALDRDRLQAQVVETEALRRSDVIKTALLRAVSHDLRTPLTSIVAAADAVRSPTLPPEERDELGALIGDEAGRLSRLVEKLLDLSRLQAGAAPPRRDWVSLEELVRTAIEHLDDRDGGVPVEISIEPELPFVRADAAQLERAFVNLLENARRYSGGHPVKVRARVVGSRIRLRVIDRGPGIAPDTLPFIFEPFHQGPDARSHGGSGLGLAIVKGFVEANGGHVAVESLPGQGTVFSIEFPLTGLPATGGHKTRPAA